MVVIRKGHLVGGLVGGMGRWVGSSHVQVGDELNDILERDGLLEERKPARTLGADGEMPELTMFACGHPRRQRRRDVAFLEVESKTLLGRFRPGILESCRSPFVGDEPVGRLFRGDDPGSRCRIEIYPNPSSLLPDVEEQTCFFSHISLPSIHHEPFVSDCGERKSTYKI